MAPTARWYEVYQDEDDLPIDRVLGDEAAVERFCKGHPDWYYVEGLTPAEIAAICNRSEASRIQTKPKQSCRRGKR